MFVSRDVEWRNIYEKETLNGFSQVRSYRSKEITDATSSQMFVTSDDLSDGHQDNPIRLCLRLIVKPQGSTPEVPAYREENFAVPEKI